jgi:hypothetical protein
MTTTPTISTMRLSIAQDNEQTLITYLAAPDSPTAERLAMLASWTVTGDLTVRPG